MKTKNMGLIFLLIFSLLSCDGTLGGFKTRSFPVSKQKLVIAIDRLYKEYPEYKIPEKWKKYDSWQKRNYGFLDTRIFYLKNNPEEMYYISFIGDGNDSIQIDKNSISIAIRSVFMKKNMSWLHEKDFNESEKRRIENRLTIDIISKLEKYTGVKSSMEN
jgi:hypothetical protein